MKQKIQKKLEELTNLCLENTEKYEGYNDEDLFNITFTFSHILLDIVWTTNEQLSIDEKSELVETIGKAIRELILASTGKDLHIITKNLLNKKEQENQTY